MDVIDLTSTEPEMLHDGQQDETPGGSTVDLTVEGEMDTLDHMQTVVDLLRSQRTARGSAHSDGAKGDNEQASPIGTPQMYPNQRSSTDPSRIAYISSDDESIIQSSRRASKQPKELQRFPFLTFPPEIRNCVYKVLLTTPNAPIELPKLTAIKERARMEKCRNATKARHRAVHKRIFLEILVTCRQVHDEATGIMYGCNVFKYRSNHREGPRATLLPTRHLQLLKHIKIAVISASPYNDQEKWVADLIKCFIKDEINLDTFEMTWYGWQRYVLEWKGLVCQALLSLKVEKQMVLNLTGEARMRRTTKAELEKEISPQRIEIHRPYNTKTGEELDDEDAE